MCGGVGGECVCVNGWSNYTLSFVHVRIVCVKLKAHELKESCEKFELE